MPILTITAAGFQANRVHCYLSKVKAVKRRTLTKVVLMFSAKTRSDFSRCEAAEPSRLPAPHSSPTSLIILLFRTAYKL